MRKVRMVQLVAASMAMMVAILITGRWEPVAAGPVEGAYRVLKPIQSGDLTIQPKEVGVSLAGGSALVHEANLSS